MAYMSPKFNGPSADVFHLETSDTTGYAVDWHAHDCHMLLLPRQGGLLLSTESSRTTHVARHSISFVPADFAHATQAAPGRESAPQAAARAVAQRLTRILGENGSLASGEAEPPAGEDATVDEITRAVSALAGENGHATEDDAPPPSMSDRSPCTKTTPGRRESLPVLRR
mgnify:CR=1 FL=1